MLKPRTSELQDAPEELCVKLAGSRVGRDWRKLIMSCAPLGLSCARVQGAMYHTSIMARGKQRCKAGVTVMY